MTKYDENLFEDQEYDEDLFEDQDYSEPMEQIAQSVQQEKEPETSGLEAFGLGTASMTGPAIGGASAVLGETVGNIGKPEYSLENLPLSSEVKDKVKKDPALLKDSEEVIQKLKDSESMKDTFYEGRDDTRKRQAKAFEEHPILNSAGMVVEGVATGGLLGMAGKAKKAADIAKMANLTKKMQILNKLKTGAKVGTGYGALHGYLTGEGKLAEGEVGTIALESLIGGGTGAVFGTVLSGVGQGGAAAIKSNVVQNVSNKIANVSNTGFKNTANFLNQSVKKLGTKDLAKSYKLGKDGVILNKRYEKIFGQKLTKELFKDLESLIKTNNLNRKEIFKLLEKNKETIDTPQAIMDTIEEIGKRSGNKETSIANVLYESIGVRKAARQAEKQAKSKASKHFDKMQNIDNKLESKAIDQTLRSGKIPDKIEYGSVKADDLFNETANPNATRRVQKQIFEPKVDDAGVLGKGKVRFNTADATQPQQVEPAINSMKQKITPKELDTIKNRLSDFITESPTASQQEKIISSEAIKLKQKLTSIMDNEISQILKKDPTLKQQLYGDINKQFNKIDNLSKELGLKSLPKSKYTSTGESVPQSAMKKQYQPIADTLMDIKDGKRPITDISIIYDMMKEIDESLLTKFKPEITKLRTMSELLASSKAKDAGSGVIVKPMINYIKNNANKIANKLGRISKEGTEKASKKTGLRVGLLKKITSSKDGISSLLKKIEKNGSPALMKFREALNAAQTGSERKRNALLFSLMGNPEIRKLMDSDKKEE